MKKLQIVAAAGIASALLAGCSQGIGLAEIPTAPVKLSVDVPAIAASAPAYRTQTLFFDTLLAVAVNTVKFEIWSKSGTKMPEVTAQVMNGKAEASIRLAPAEYSIDAYGYGAGATSVTNAKGTTKTAWNVVDAQGAAVSLDMYQRLEPGKRYSNLKLGTGAEDRYYFESKTGSKYTIRVWDDLGGDMVVHGAIESWYAQNRNEGSFKFHDDDNDVNRNGEAVDALSAGARQWFKVATRMASASYNVEIVECATSDAAVTLVAK